MGAGFWALASTDLGVGSFAEAEDRLVKTKVKSKQVMAFKLGKGIFLVFDKLKVLHD